MLFSYGAGSGSIQFAANVESSFSPIALSARNIAVTVDQCLITSGQLPTGLEFDNVTGVIWSRSSVSGTSRVILTVQCFNNVFTDTAYTSSASVNVVVNVVTFGYNPPYIQTYILEFNFIPPLELYRVSFAQMPLSLWRQLLHII